MSYLASATALFYSEEQIQTLFPETYKSKQDLLSLWDLDKILSRSISLNWSPQVNPVCG